MRQELDLNWRHGQLPGLRAEKSEKTGISNELIVNYEILLVSFIFIKLYCKFISLPEYLLCVSEREREIFTVVIYNKTTADSHLRLYIYWFWFFKCG